MRRLQRRPRDRTLRLLGAGFIDADLRVGDTRISSELGQGLGFLANAGYDIGVSRRVSITPAVNFWYGWPGDLRIQGETLARDWSQNVVDFTIGLTIR